MGRGGRKLLICADIENINTAIQADTLPVNVCIYEELANGEFRKTTWLKAKPTLKGNSEWRPSLKDNGLDHRQSQQKQHNCQLPKNKPFNTPTHF